MSDESWGNGLMWGYIFGITATAILTIANGVRPVVLLIAAAILVAIQLWRQRMQARRG